MLENIKKIDFYRKYTNAEQQTQTIIGAFCSLLAITIMVILVGSELNIYFSQKLNKSVALDKSTAFAKGDTMPMNIDITFPKIPCRCLEMLKRDSFGLKLLSLKSVKTLSLIRLDSEGQILDSDFISDNVLREFPEHLEQAKISLTQMLNNEGCRVAGTIEIHKVFFYFYLKNEKSPGFLQFFVNINHADFMDIQSRLAEITKKLSFEHVLTYLTFGNVTDQEQMAIKLKNTHITQFNKMNAKFLTENSCYYYMKSVPHWFYIGGEEQSHETYQYSMDFFCENNVQTVGGYQVAFVYDMSAIGIIYNILFLILFYPYSFILKKQNIINI